jgi:soluble P-type ATPase
MVDGHRVTVGRLPDTDALPLELGGAVGASAARGDTVVSVVLDDRTVGLISLATPVRADAAPAVAGLHRLGLRTAILSGDAAPAVDAVAAAVGIDSARAGLTPGQKLDALRVLQAGDHRVAMVGDGVNDAPALAAADVGCAVGGSTEAALANSDVALLGSDLRGVPGAIGIAGATSSVILQNFGWAMGYNISALPLAAAGLLDPLVAALAMGLSSLVVVVNSLRLVRLGRTGVDRIRPPTVMRGVRGLVLSVAVPVLLFGGATVAFQAVSPSRGQSLLPSLPSITTVALPHGVSAEVYLRSSQAGANEVHLIFTEPTAPRVAVTDPVLAAARRGAEPVALRLARIAPLHLTAFPVLAPGAWVFTVTVHIDGRPRTFTVSRTLS